MIDGTVNANLEATISLTVGETSSPEREILAVIDTGFDGFLTLPPAVISDLNLSWRMCGRAMLADGSEILVDIFEATVIWNGCPCRIVVDSADSAPLIGMALLKDCELTIQVFEGGTVTIEPVT